MGPRITIGILLTVSVEGKNGMDYICSVLGFNRYGMELSLPQVLGQVQSLPVDTPVTCYYVSEDRLLAFKTHVMGYQRTAPPSMVVAMPTELTEVNRRGSLRFKVNLPVQYIVEGKALSGEQTETRDLSLGGLCMATRIPLEHGALLTLTLELPTDTLLLSAKAVWSDYRGSHVLTGVEFTRMRQQTMGALNLYLLGLQRSKKGM